MSWQVVKRDLEVRRGPRSPRAPFFLFPAPGCEVPEKFTKASASRRDQSAVFGPVVPVPSGSPGAQGAGEVLAGKGREIAAAAWRGSRGPTWLLQELCYFATF